MIKTGTKCYVEKNKTGLGYIGILINNRKPRYIFLHTAKHFNQGSTFKSFPENIKCIKVNNNWIKYKG